MMKLLSNSDSCFALRCCVGKGDELAGSYCDFEYQSKVSCQWCSIGHLVKYHYCKVSQAPVLAVFSYIARESQAMGRRQSMGSPYAEEPTNLIIVRKFRPSCNVVCLGHETWHLYLRPMGMDLVYS